MSDESSPAQFAYVDGEMRRVLVIGGPGAGKTTFAIRLASALGVPVVHLDAHFWQAGWRQPTPEAWAARAAGLAEGERWVMDGHYRSTLAIRARAADAVVVLVPPRLACVSRLIRRGLRDRGRQRADLATGCLEQMPGPGFLSEAWSFGTTKLPLALAILAGPEAMRADGTRAPVSILRSTSEIERFLRLAREGAAQRIPSPASLSAPCDGERR